MLQSLNPRLKQKYLSDCGCYSFHRQDTDQENMMNGTTSHRPVASLNGDPTLDRSREDVAVIGMACKLPGAEDINAFWKLLCRAESQHVEVPPERFGFDTAWRQSGDKKWYGNFVRDHDVFDEKFFKKSPREAASTDPQQRLMLQVAYQAVEQSGYFNSDTREGDRDNNIGCYIALGLNDYEGNISYYPANAYSATGNLKAFAAGKISHYFGWNGPGLTVDTACSSSTVAVHLACQSILSGECSAALVGGVNIMTGPDWFHNLGGASFLSPTGQCKPFDVSADGYCRGEAVAAVFLKRLSLAIRDGDQIHGVIAASSVQQNANCTAVTVPNGPSLTNLFHKVTRQAGLAPYDISYVEAHGTGTVVGDPAEYASVRSTFGGPIRENSGHLSLGSVKGLLGHTEVASGIVSLLKIISMLHHGVIPPQASFKSINPALKSTSDDQIKISTVVQPWYAEFRAALINNYGASGSNASMVVTQPPRFHTPIGAMPGPHTDDQKRRYPIAIFASDEQALQRYSRKLLEVIRSNKTLSLADLSFQLAQQANKALRCTLAFSCETLRQLEQRLAERMTGSPSIAPPRRPVILCFGGQRSTFVGLDQRVYDASTILRTHLDRCNSVCEDLGTSIYPAIFQTTGVQDIVQLHASLFSLQYACAQSWLDCMPGVEIAAVVGHSFGELSALCVAGAVSLGDMLKFVVGRARLIRDAWSSEKGSMLAIEADFDVVARLLIESEKSYKGPHAASIACFNALKSFTVAGATKAIDAVVQTASTQSQFGSVKTKRLDVTNAYHCSLVDSVLQAVLKLSSQVKFQKPMVHIELATDKGEQLQSQALLANNLRQPVYFCNAVQRLVRKLDSAIWLEAGSASTVTTMASRALDVKVLKDHHFQPVNITEGATTQGLADVTTALWREGLGVSFWPHHRGQAKDYRPIFLPPYQFEKNKHWMERKSKRAVAETPKNCDNTVWSFAGEQDPTKRSVRCHIHTESEAFQSVLRGHVIGGDHPLCPSTFQLEIVVDALIGLRHNNSDATHQPQLIDVVNAAPLTHKPGYSTWLDAKATDKNCLAWGWTIYSTRESDSAVGQASVTHVTGKVLFVSTSETDGAREFKKLKRLVRRTRCQALLDDDETSDVIQGKRHIYKLFADVVKYSDNLQGLQRFVGKGDKESAARIVHPGTDLASDRAWFDYAMADCFCQVAGVFVNTMTDKALDEIFVSTGIDQWIRSPGIDQRPSVLEAYACHDRPSQKEFSSDVFIFDPEKGELIEAVLGIHFKKTSKTALSRVLAQMTGSPIPLGTDISASGRPAATVNLQQDKDLRLQKETENHHSRGARRSDVDSKLRGIVASLSGLDVAEIVDKAQLADLGIDSLMGMELARELQASFKCAVPANILLELTDFRSLVTWIEQVLGISTPEDLHTTGTVEPEDVRVKPNHNPNHDESLNASDVNREVSFDMPAAQS